MTNRDGNFVPPVLVNPMDRRLSRFDDPIFEAGYETLNKLTNPKREHRGTGARFATLID